MMRRTKVKSIVEKLTNAAAPRMNASTIKENLDKAIPLRTWKAFAMTSIPPLEPPLLKHRALPRPVKKPPSKARNNGIINSTGDFLVFVDDDDYISKDFFENIDSHVDGKDDMLKYNALYVGNRIPSDSFATDSFGPMDGEQALKYLIESKKIFATLWQYVFRRDLFTENDLFLLDDNIHEDYGLVPTLILYSDSIKGIDYIGYNYIYKEGSLSTNQNYEAVVKRAFDMLEQYDYLKHISDTRIKDPNVKAVFDKYITDSVLRKVKKLKDEELKRFERELTRRRII